MTRDVSPTNLTALDNPSIIDGITFVKIVLDAQDIFLHNSVGDITFDSDTYIGLGGLGRISDVIESNEITNEPLTLQLATITDVPESTDIVNEIAQAVIDEDWRGRSVEIFIGIPDPTSQVLVDDPFIVFSGEVSHIYRTIDQGTFDLNVVCVRRWADWSRKNERRFTDAEHQSLFPGDKFFEFVANMEVRSIDWRGSRVTYANTPSDRLGGSNRAAP